MGPISKKLDQKLLEFQCSVEKIKKDGKNPHFKSTYATLTHILSEVKPLLNALKIVVTQPLDGDGDRVCTILTDTETGEQVISAIKLPTGLNAQQTGSAITYYRRYTLSSLLALEIEDDDGNTASRPPVKKLQDQVIEAISLLESSKSLEELASKWKALGAEMQPHCESVKEQMKNKLKPVAA